MVKLPAHFRHRLRRSHLRLFATIAFLIVAALLSRGLSAPLGQEPVVVEWADTAVESATHDADSASTYRPEAIARAQQQLAVVVPEQTIEQLLLASAPEFTDSADGTSSSTPTLLPPSSFEDPDWSMNELHPHLALAGKPNFGWTSYGGVGLIGAMPFAGGGGGGGSSSSPGSLADAGLDATGGRSSSTQPGVGGGDNVGADQGGQGNDNGNGDQGTNGNGGKDGDTSNDGTPNYRDLDDDSQNFPDGRGPHGVGPGGSDSTPVAVPEPASLLLTGLGLAGLITVRRRRRDR